ncbi:hypothetical protein [Tsuneonella amylolytica]|uniref:hypothetical protein n=1 Tax=Tsuneonella amylolytica TaxID=2338327 RepID=UPI000EA9E0EC|nr:hypothetical protein [Tsuneonella amylolytica]
MFALLPVLAAWAWYAWSPRLALAALTDFDASPADIARLYDRDAVRAGFAAQTEPAVDSYPPPLTKGVVLDALSDPRAIRMLVVEPYGQWQFAAWDGLPQRIRTVLDADDDSQTGSMPRMLETTANWSIERRGLSGFAACGADRPGGKTYRFVRRGLSWRLVHIELEHTIR